MVLFCDIQNLLGTRTRARFFIDVEVIALCSWINTHREARYSKRIRSPFDDFRILYSLFLCSVRWFRWRRWILDRSPESPGESRWHLYVRPVEVDRRVRKGSWSNFRIYRLHTRKTGQVSTDVLHAVSIDPVFGFNAKMRIRSGRHWNHSDDVQMTCCHSTVIVASLSFFYSKSIGAI